MDSAARPLSVLVLGISWPPETFLARLISGLAYAGVEVTVACEKKPAEEWLNHPKIHWMPMPTFGGSVGLRLLNLLWLIVKTTVRTPRAIPFLISVLQKTKNPHEVIEVLFRAMPLLNRRSDVIYFPWNSAAIAHLPLFDLGYPVVVSCRGAQVNVAPHNPKRIAIRTGLFETFQRAVAVHCVSEAIKRQAMQYGLEEAKACVIPPAVDSAFFSKRMHEIPPDDNFRVVTTGSLIWRKGYEYALTAIRHLVDDGIPVRFDIIGDGSERQRILFTIRDLGLEEHIHLCGALNPEAVRDRLQQAHVFLLSSLSEGISNAVLEAMACGLPVVTTDCGGMREAVTHGKDGLVVPVRDSQAIANALRLLRQDKKLGEQMGLAGKEKVSSKFRADIQIEKFIGLYETARGAAQ